MIDDEKTIKSKDINIDFRNISTILRFSIDKFNKDVLVFNYIINALNDSFTSIPIKIDLDKNNDNIIGLLNYLKRNCTNYFSNIIIPLNDTDKLIFMHTDELDDTGRRIVSISYIKSDNSDYIIIPVDILPIFIDTFITILDDKDIVDIEPVSNDDEKSEEEDIEDSKEDNIDNTTIDEDNINN